MPLTNRPNRTFLLIGLLVICACNPAVSEYPAVPVEQLPPYTPQEQRVFDDSIAPEVFGLSVSGGGPSEPKFATRVTNADLITRAKLQTITRDKISGQVRYHVVLKLIGDPIVGHSENTNIEITVGRTSPSLTLLRSMASKGVGRTMLVLLRRYRLGNERVLHFRGEPDTDVLLQAVREALRRKI